MPSPTDQIKQDLDDDLLSDIIAAEVANGTRVQCDACEVIAAVSENVRPALIAAMAGTIGEQKLSTILANRGYNVGRRAIARHRQEGHNS